MKLIIGYLYGDLMNIYGDTGNIIALKKRAEWRGIEVEVKNISVGDKLKPGEVDIFFFGGGQDQNQIEVAKDLEKHAQVIKEEIERGVPLLSICGGYQLLGEYYQPFDGPKLPGVGIFPAYTEASHERMIGNIVIKPTDTPIHRYTVNNIVIASLPNPLIVGFENHSGKTYLRKGAQSFGKIITGYGNNGQDKMEGCQYKNAIGCYMHGSLLPKNPELADWLIQKALEVKYNKEIELQPLDDDLENQAHKSIISKL